MFSLYNNIIADHGLYINLPSSTDRLHSVEKQIQQFEINDLSRVEALTDPLHQSSATKSHLHALEIADKEGYESICVFEDDFQLYENVSILFDSNAVKLKDYLPELCDHLKTVAWDVVLLGFNGRKHCIPVSHHLSKNFRSTGAWAYLINKKTYQYILNHFSYYRDRLAIDDIIPYLTYLGFNSLVTNVQIFHHGVGFISTLQPSLGPTNYSHWIWGNYQRTIWNSLDTNTPIGFHNSLQKIYDDNEFSRNNILQISNFNGDIENLQNFMHNHPEYYSTYSELLNNHDLPNVGYYLNVESSYLIHGLGIRDKVCGLGNNIVTASL